MKSRIQSEIHCDVVHPLLEISQKEFESIEEYVKFDNPEDLNNPSILVLFPEMEECELCNRMASGYTDTKIFILKAATVDLYFVKYISNEQLYLNGLPIRPGIVYTFAKGSSIRSQQGRSIYYSDISSRFLSDIIRHKISFTAENLSFYFREGHAAINDISFSVEEGKLVVLGRNK